LVEKGEAEKNPGRAPRNWTFTTVDYLILITAVVVFLAGWFVAGRVSHGFNSMSFFSRGFSAEYEVEGTLARELGSDRLQVRTLEEGEETATIQIEAGENVERFDVNRKTALVLQDTQTGVPLIFFYDTAKSPRDVSATFGDESWPYVSTEFTGLTGSVRARVKKSNPENAVMWYHRSPEESYGPQYAWELQLYNEDNEIVGTTINDMSGLLLNARFYQNGLGSMNLTSTNYPVSAGRWVLFIGLNAILLLWGCFHVLRAGRHSQEWEAHWSYFPLDYVGISRFLIRLLAFTIFDFVGIGVLTGNMTVLFITNLVGLALMAYAVGVFAFPVIFNFVPWIAAFGVSAGGRSLEYVQYPFGVPLYLVAVVSYLLYRYLSYRGKQRQGLQVFLDSLPDVTRDAIVRELESEPPDTDNGMSG